MKFSERFGYSPVRNIQIKSMDKELHISLWNVIQIYFLKHITIPNFVYRRDGNNFYYIFRNEIWSQHLKKVVDDLKDSTLRTQFREIYFYNLDWYKVYDLLEYIVNKFPPEISLTNKNYKKNKFIENCNSVLKRENSAYRIVGEKITPITSEVEIQEIEEALEDDDYFKLVSIHIKDALKFLSDREEPNYRNSIKESISAVEAMCQIIIQNTNTTLGKALKKIEDHIKIQGALKNAFSQLYGYTSNEGGIRHALLDESHIDLEDAKFMLVSCSAFTNYLKVKISKANLKLK